MEANIKVGDTLFYAQNSRHESSIHGSIRPVTVSKIGNRYLYTNEFGDRLPISKDGLKCTNREYSQNNVQFYTTEQEILDLKEKDMLYNRIRRHFDMSWNTTKNTLDQFRQIADILGINELKQ